MSVRFLESIPCSSGEENNQFFVGQYSVGLNVVAVRVLEPVQDEMRRINAGNRIRRVFGYLFIGGWA
jgi:hypothetical protein